MSTVKETETVDEECVKTTVRKTEQGYPCFISEYSKDVCEVIDITDSVVIGEAPEYILSRMDQ